MVFSNFLAYIDIKTFIIPVFVYAVSMCITPGPNNTLLMATGANFGFKKAVPYMLGVWLGTTIVFLLSGFWLWALLKDSVIAQKYLKILGSVFIAYLAIKLLRADTTPKAEGQRQAPKNCHWGFGTAVIFQFVNIKIWASAVAGIAAYVPEGPGYISRMAVFVIIFFLVRMTTTTLWALGGVVIKKQSPRLVKQINLILAILLLLTIAGLYI